MNDAVERFRRVRAIRESMGTADENSGSAQLTEVREDAVEIALTSYLENRWTRIPQEAEALLAELHGRIDAERMGLLIESCRRECVQAVIRPLGVGRVLFKDKDGGSVDTVHNVRNNIWATDKERKKYTSEVFGKEGESTYDSTMYHSDKAYTDSNRMISQDVKEGLVVDSYGGQTLTKGGNGKSSANVNLDYVISAHEIYHDPGRVLAEKNGVALANHSTNLKPITERVNKSKKQKSVQEYLGWLDEVKLPVLKREIARLEGNDSRTEKDEARLLNKKQELSDLVAIDREKIIKADEIAREKYDSEINKYYVGRKFRATLTVASLSAGGKMGLQQAVGVLMEEFVHAAFDEMADIWRNGFKGDVDDSFLKVLKSRLERVGKRVLKIWREAGFSFIHGAVSGFFSNILTVAINAFVTTAAKWVRIIREGFMSLYQAFKMLAFPPKDITLEEAAHAATKVLAAGLVTGLGILMEEAIEKALLAVSGPLAVAVPYVTPVIAGVVTGLMSAFTVYLVDRIDLFGVNGKQRHEQVIAQLNATIDSDYERGMQAAREIENLGLLRLEQKLA